MTSLFSFFLFYCCVSLCIYIFIFVYITNANPADLMTKPPLGPNILQLMKIMDYEFVGQSSRQEKSYGVKLVGVLTDVKEKADSLAAATAK